jgi:hypothetical protein
MTFNTFNPKERRYFKSNFADLLEVLTPGFYVEEDLAISGVGLNPLSEVINCHIKLCNNINRVLPISGVNGTQTEHLGNISGISQYFVKQNELTEVIPGEFEVNILNPLNYSLKNFDTSADFKLFLSSTLLPKIIPANNTNAGSIQANISVLSALTDNANASSVHNFLVDALGWFYFLNTSANGGLSYSPSSYVLESLASLYRGKTLKTVDGIKGLTEYLWRNNSVCSFDTFIPTSFISGTVDAILTTSAGIAPTYTSGTQKLEALKTLIDIVYSPLDIDKKDFKVKDAFDSFLDSGLYLDDEKSKGPYRKFLSLLGYSFADVSDKIEKIGLIYDIENVEDNQLQHIADLIGFKLRGNLPSKWRHQLSQAIELYKSSGTLECLQKALNILLMDSTLEVSSTVQELWESYIPHLIWYALATESPLFKDLNTWTLDLAQQSRVNAYSNKSLEDNLKLVTDSIILDVYKYFPEAFVFNGQNFDPPRFYTVDKYGNETGLYTIVGEADMKPFSVALKGTGEYAGGKTRAALRDENKMFEAATGFNVLGEGVYIAGELGINDTTDIVYLKPKGDIRFLFNYRDRVNYPLPPFEEFKYYKDCSITYEIVDFIVERLKCFKVKESFADSLGSYIKNSIDSTSDLGALNEWLFFFSSLQTPPNFDDVIYDITDYDHNILSLWNGKSSHLFINFQDTDLDFSVKNLQADGAYALYETARLANEFTPAHTINRVNMSGSAVDSFIAAHTEYDYIGFDDTDTLAGYTSGSVLAGFATSGAAMSFATGGGDNGVGSDGGRGGLNTFKREAANNILDSILSSTTAIITTPRRSHRRRNLKYLLPREGYFDRTGFNGPTSFDPSVLERSMASSLGELTLGYIASAAKFHPVVDTFNLSGVWHPCENLSSTRRYFGVDTSNTFPYRGLYPLSSNNKMPEVGSGVSRYVDRGQTPGIYYTMHKLFSEKARSLASKIIEATPSDYLSTNYWKNNIESLANSAIASGFVLTSFDDYENFSFGNGLHKLYADYCKYFNRHDISLNQIEKTGGNIFAHTFGRGLFNCNFSVDGSAITDYLAKSVGSVSSINNTNIWKSTTTGTYIASSVGQTVIPLIGSFVSGDPFNAEFRNPHILSGIEFCDISGSPSNNQFMIFELDPSNAIPRAENYYVGNRLIKCKSVGGLPRLRFDLSAYGDRRNYLSQDHKFNLKINALVADEYNPILGGGQIGVWIHTQPVSGFLWTWTPNNMWEVISENRISIDTVRSLSHIYTFNINEPPLGSQLPCIGRYSDTATIVNNASITGLSKSYLETVSINFDTRNYTTENNFEYLKVIPKDVNISKLKELVHTIDTNYIIEIFFVPNNDINKYLLIDSIELQDLTLRDYAGIGTGYGIETSGVPLKRFVKEDKIYLNEEELFDVIKFFNGLIGQGTGQYATNLASRNAMITSGTLEVSGGSRLNYRTNPDWVPNVKAATYNNYTSVEFDN